MSATVREFMSGGCAYAFVRSRLLGMRRGASYPSRVLGTSVRSAARVPMKSEGYCCLTLPVLCVFVV